VDQRAGLDDVEKRIFLTLPGLELQSVVQPVASHYTDYALLYVILFTYSTKILAIVVLVTVEL
jgi:hypothetical protein